MSLVIALFFISTLTSCSLFSGKKNPQSIKVTLLASSDINPNIESKPAPLGIYIYELKTPDTFDNSDYYSIIKNTNNEFSQQSSKLYQAILLPGEKRHIEISPEKSSVALGVVATFRDINHADWNKTIMFPAVKPVPWWKLMHSEEKYILSIDFSKTSISKIKWIKM
ncbi:type VI secretion system lipoprotein TssJ [Erwinia sp. AnSW2-5]|uniref:type VI secretion system lipoprotein TssJ n=1 Tax=Erwinia sp. AnSW2-5 TaxID=3367692 RepID=UPI0038598408